MGPSHPSRERRRESSAFAALSLDRIFPLRCPRVGGRDDDGDEGAEDDGGHDAAVGRVEAQGVGAANSIHKVGGWNENV